MKFPIQFLYTGYRKALNHPQYRWWVILGTLVYFLSPIDISPDLIPIIGQIDDFTLLTLLFTGLSQIIFESRQSSNLDPNPEPKSVETIDVDAVKIE